MIEKIRTIITQDAEVDDRNSLRHFLLYANEVEVLGIIQTSSKFHWKGIPGAVKPEKKIKDDFDREFAFENGPYDAPYRWPGTEWMWEMIDHYEKDYPNLCKHAEWIDELKQKYGSFIDKTEETVIEILKTETGIVFSKVLEHAGVYKCNQEGLKSFETFISSL